MKDLSIKARVFILGSIGLGLICLIWLLDDLQAKAAPLVVLAGLATLAQLLKVEGATDRSSYNLSWVIYGFAFVLYGAPETMLLILCAHLAEWIVRGYRWYIQSFNIANYSIALFLAGSVYGWANHSAAPIHLSGALSLLAGLAIITISNHLFVGLAIWIARRETIAQSGVFGRLTLMMDFTLLGMGAASAMIWLINPYAIFLSIVPLYVIYSTLKIPALQRQTELDPKTGLFNARHFAEELERELERARRFDRQLTVVLGDLDLLRNINNTYGHLAGDAVLKRIAEVLQEAFRDYDTVARFGGEEFAILLPESRPEEAFPRLEAVRRQIQSEEIEVSTSVTPIKATMSFGIAGLQERGQTASELIHNADVALYLAKLNGRNMTTMYSQAGMEDFFGLEEGAPSYPEMNSLEDRVQAGSYPFQPNPLRTGIVARAAADYTPGPPEPAPPPAAPEPEKRDPARARLLTRGYIAALNLIAVLVIYALYEPGAAIDWPGLMVFAGIVLLTQFLAIEVYVRENSVSTSAAPFIAGSFLFGPVGAALLSLLVAGTAMIKRQSQPSRFFFNAANHLIAGAICLALVRITGRAFSELDPWIQVSLAVLAGGLNFVSGSLLIAGAMSLSVRRPILEIWREQFRWLAPYYLALGIVAYAFIYSYLGLGVIGVIVILAPLLMLRFSQFQYIEHTKGMVRQLCSKNQQLEQSAQEISKLNEELLRILAQVIDLRDPYTLGHSENVSRLAVRIAEEMRLPKKRVELIRKAGLLHDIGKLGIAEAILFKPDRLTAEEYERVKSHTVLGDQIIKNSSPLRTLAPFIRHHHERFDGDGYPDALEGHDIPLEARILNVVDSFDAMASNRPYRKALDMETIVEELERNAGTQFDPKVVEALFRVLEQEGYLVGLDAEEEAARAVKSEVQAQYGLEGLGSPTTT